MASRSESERGSISDEDLQKVVDLRSAAASFQRTADSLREAAEILERESSGVDDIGEVFFVWYAVAVPEFMVDPQGDPRALLSSLPRYIAVRADCVADAMRKAAGVDFADWRTSRELQQG